MRDKTEARQSKIATGVPVTPGSEGNLTGLDNAIEKAAEIGYPIILKATSVESRVLRRCDNEQKLRQNYPRVIPENIR